MAKKNVFNNKWVAITSIIAIVFMILGGGYSAGIYQGEVQCILDKNELVITYQEKLNQAQSTIKDYETKSIEEKSSNLNEVVEYLKKQK